jgi:hypothetical protein
MYILFCVSIDTYSAELAGMGEDRRAVALEVLAVLDPRRGAGEDLGEPALASRVRGRQSSVRVLAVV